MAVDIVSRGPDDLGVWHDDAVIGLAHRCLSILDLSPVVHQPMHSIFGPYVIAFNGEINHHLDLRNELKNTNWRGHSDTETLLASFEEWGIEATSLVSGLLTFDFSNGVVFNREASENECEGFEFHGTRFCFSPRMNSGRYILSYVLDLVHWQTLSRLSERFNAEARVRHFGGRQQFICMVFPQ